MQLAAGASVPCRSASSAPQPQTLSAMLGWHTSEKELGMKRICPSGDQDGRSAKVLEVMLTKGLTILCTTAQSAVLLHPQAVSQSSCRALHPDEAPCRAASWAEPPQPSILVLAPCCKVHPSHAWLVVPCEATLQVLRHRPCPVSKAATPRQRQGTTASSTPSGAAHQMAVVLSSDWLAR